MDESLKKLLEERKGTYLQYECKITTEKMFPEANDFLTLQRLLESYGIHFEVNTDKEGKKMQIWTTPEWHLRKNSRNAGRKRNSVLKQTEAGNVEAYRYSDILLMMQSMKDDEIMQATGMKSATYYRHKKALKNSNYYKKIDKTKLDDLEYLKSIAGDYLF